MAAQLIEINGAYPEVSVPYIKLWQNLATTSLPVPLSPVIRIDETRAWANFLIFDLISFISPDSPIMSFSKNSELTLLR